MIIRYNQYTSTCYWVIALKISKEVVHERTVVLNVVAGGHDIMRNALLEVDCPCAPMNLERRAYNGVDGQGIE